MKHWQKDMTQQVKLQRINNKPLFSNLGLAKLASFYYKMLTVGLYSLDLKNLYPVKYNKILLLMK